MESEDMEAQLRGVVHTAAISAHELYSSLKSAGFKEDQAFGLLEIWWREMLMATMNTVPEEDDE